jgi:hypothetical protein
VEKISVILKEKTAFSFRVERRKTERNCSYRKQLAQVGLNGKQEEPVSLPKD